VDSLIKQGLSSKAHFFATAGERGVVRIWRSDTGTCVYTYSGSSSCLLGSSGSSGGSGGSGGSSGSTKKRQKTALGAAEVVAAAAGSELLELMLLPGGKGLLAATGDARLLFFHPKVEDAAAGSSGSSSKVSDLSLTRQLVGNFDEITDLAFVYNTGSSSSSNDEDPGQQQQQRTAADGSTAAGLVLQPHEPRRLAVATNSHDIRLFELADASCVGDFVGHRDIVVCLDTVRPAAGGWVGCLVVLDS
jgi:U3 small nucleolar RNA-associated protein 13